MRPRSLAEVAAAVEGTVRGAADGVVRAVAVDSRSVGPGDLFVALPGERADGHAFVADALARGATAAMVRRGTGGEGGTLVEVEDPAAALLRLARHERRGLSARVVGITGSTGKTCTKDFTAAALGAAFRVVSSPASFNNEVGLPLTLLQADERTEAIVCEMGSRGPGHIRLLCEVAAPSIGVVTNVGVAHMELFGSPEVLRDAKAELPESLPPGGAAILNADDPVVRGYARRTKARAVTFGIEQAADIAARDLEVEPETGRAAFALATPEGSARVRLPVPGEHMVPDALAAAAVAWVLGVPLETCAGALEAADMAGGRMEVVEAGGLRIVNDAYNANPTSMAAALRAARWMAGSRRCVAVLGHMAELGPIAEREHERVGELAAALGIDALIVVGEQARGIGAGALRARMDQERVSTVDDVEEAARLVRSTADPGDLVLVKASRVARLERVAELLEDAPAPSRSKEAAG